VLEDFSVDDIARHWQGRGWLGRGGWVINMVILRGSPTLERVTYIRAVAAGERKSTASVPLLESGLLRSPGTEVSSS